LTGAVQLEREVKVDREHLNSLQDERLCIRLYQPLKTAPVTCTREGIEHLRFDEIFTRSSRYCETVKKEKRTHTHKQQI